MDKTQKMKQEKKYEAYVKQKTPVHNIWLNMGKAFVTGGIICTAGQLIYNYCKVRELSKDACSGWTSLLLILLSIILTNSVAAPAIEYKKEGQVFGIGCKIFTIAGPVILYGIFTTWVLGFLYWLWGIM